MLISYTGNNINKYITMDEICDNAIYDNNGGLIDLNDPQCICE